nr:MULTISPECIES: helix-turn-helix transcriptional regulator [unclassified Xanthobacter]
MDTRPAGAAIGARLRAERTRAGISQQRLGARLGVTFQQIQKYESGANRISLVTADVLATIFAVPVATFLALQQPRGHSSETSTQVEPGKEAANAH